MKIIWTVGLLIWWDWGSLQGQSVSIYGQQPDYAEKTIQISIDRNPFIDSPQHIATLVCSDSGSFGYRFSCETRRIVAFETGIYLAYLYVEPGYDYRVQFPAYREINYAERISPYYQPVHVPLRVLSKVSQATSLQVDNTQDLNYLIACFDSAFITANEGVILDRRLGKESGIDSLIMEIESNFTSDTSRFFRNYRRYKYGALMLNEGKTGLEYISQNYLGPVINDSHPGFMELFGAMFRDFFYYYSRTSRGKGLMNHINRTHNLDSVRVALQRHPAIWNDTLADMVLLQELPGLFYSGDFHQESILILLDSMEANPVTPEFARFTAQLNQKLSSLMIGNPPPLFSLPDLNGRRYTLEDFQGKYVYLMFCTPDHYGCMMEYPFLQSFHQKHAAYLEVVTVMVADDESLLQDFMNRNGYDWKTLFFEDRQEVLSAFLVKAFPTAYLIGPDGNLVLSPSALPSDGFEQQLFRIMRSKGEI